MIDWNDLTLLTREEFNSFISAAIPFLKRMELKNHWDFSINDDSSQWFCERFLMEAFRLNKYENHQRYNPKVTDMNAIYDILCDSDWTEEDNFIRNNDGVKIWEVVLNKINIVADSVLN